MPDKYKVSSFSSNCLSVICHVEDFEFVHNMCYHHEVDVEIKGLNLFYEVVQAWVYTGEFITTEYTSNFLVSPPPQEKERETLLVLFRWRSIK